MSRASIVIVVLVLAVLACFLFPTLLYWRGQSQKTTCLYRIGELAKSLGKHQEAKTFYPLASTQPIDHKPGSTDAETAAGFSWIAEVLPYMDGYASFGESFLKMPGDNLPFDPKLEATYHNNSLQPATLHISSLLCPSFGGADRVAEADSDYGPLTNGLPTVSNYYAFAGTNFVNATGVGRLFPPEQLKPDGPAFEGNGGLPFPGHAQGKLTEHGLPIDAIKDGTSNTFACAESIEQAYAAWIDGQSMWFVAAWPGNSKLPITRLSGDSQVREDHGWSADEIQQIRIAINLRKPDGSPITYMDAGRWSGTKPRRWAASSNHPGVVNHAFLDGHAVSLTIDIDPNLYIYATSRDGVALLHPISPEDR